MLVEQTIVSKLTEHFQPQHLEVINESHMHSVPPNSETHFKVVIVSEAFEQCRAVKRHQLVYAALAEELEGPVHALALHTHAPQEWTASQQQVPDSPDCRGGSQSGS